MINTSIIQVFEGELYVGTFQLSKMMNIPHRLVKNLIKKYSSILFSIGAELFQIRLTRKRGTQIQEYLLDFLQLKILTVLIDNRHNVIDLKIMCLKDHETPLQFFREYENICLSVIQKYTML